MITIFTVPKAFNSRFATIQENALSSWKLLSDDIILCGNEKGVTEIAQKYRIRHISDIRTNQFGTPILSDVFNKVVDKARFPILAYVNCDVILPKEFISAISQIPFKKFLLVGRRRNISLSKKISVEGNWQQKLEHVLVLQDRVHPVGNSSEFFAFPKAVTFRMPDFAVGRLYWDSWLIYRAQQLKIPVIDGTEMIPYFHQIHGYSHHPEGFEGVWYGQEAQKNFQLAGGEKSRFKVTDADLILTSQGLQKPALTARLFVRKLRVFGFLHPQFSVVSFPLYLIAMILFKSVMFLKVLKTRGIRIVIDAIQHPEQLQNKLIEL